MNNKNYALEISHVEKEIENGRQKNTILKDISFRLETGSITAIVGKSGCGKSTLLSIAGGIDAPTKGTVLLLGKDYYRMPETDRECFRNENVGLLFQSYHLISELTCEENIRMPVCFSRNKNRFDEKNLDNWIKKVGLADKRFLFPAQMSGGEQQRTAILRAIVNHPKILFADEPTGALDSGTGNQIIRFLAEYAHKSGTAILLVTHDMDVAGQCDRIIEMADGKIVP